jgi:uncharacterized phage protein gp47/JayE
MSDYGLTTEGFLPKTFEVITKELQDELISNLGPLNFDDNSVIANIVNIFAEREALIWQATGFLYDSMSPSAATGVSLDNQVGLIGLKRLVASYSYVTAQITAENYTTIPEGSIAFIENKDVNFLLVSDVVVSNESCVGISVRITDNTATKYSLTINGKVLTHIKIEPSEEVEEDTTATIATSLKDLIDQDADLKEFLIVKVTDSTLDINSNSYMTVFAVYIGDEMVIENCIANASFRSETKGSIAVPVNSLTQMKSLVLGFLSINNDAAGITVRDNEDDYDLRERRKASLSLPGRGTLEALRAKVLNLKEVTAVLVEENTGDETIGILTPHSFLVTVNGGSDEDIGAAIWMYKPIAIASVGEVSVTASDLAGNPQVVKFNIAKKIYAFIDIALTTDNTFDMALIDIIKSEIIDNILSLTLGQTLIYQTFFSIIYRHKGILNASLLLGKSDNPDATNVTKTAANITIDSHEIIVSDTSKINITT